MTPFKELAEEFVRMRNTMKDTRHIPYNSHSCIAIRRREFQVRAFKMKRLTTQPSSNILFRTLLYSAVVPSRLLSTRDHLKYA